MHFYSSGEEESLCIICDNKIEPEKEVIVKQRGIQSLIKASIERKDKKHLKLENLEEVKVHKLCQSSYQRARNIEAAAKRVSDEYKDRRNELSAGRKFKYSECCFYCDEKVNIKDQSTFRVVKKKVLLIMFLRNLKMKRVCTIKE